MTLLAKILLGFLIWFISVITIACGVYVGIKAYYKED